jgi:RNA polymerase sigma factor (sigma-70 family)
MTTSRSTYFASFAPLAPHRFVPPCRSVGHLVAAAQHQPGIAYNRGSSNHFFVSMRSASARSPVASEIASEIANEAPVDSAVDEVLDSLAVLMQAVPPHNAAAQVAFRKLFDATASRVYAIARRITHNEAHAEEVVSDTYMQVWRDASRFDPMRGNVIAWLTVIARTRALDLLRKQEDWVAVPEAQALEIAMFDAQSADTQGVMTITSEVAPDRWVEALEEKSQLAQAMAQLRPVQRQLLALAYFKGLSHQEIADNTGLALGTVKTHIRRGLAALKVEMQQPELRNENDV